MAAFDALPVELQQALLRRVDFRRERYLAMNNQRWKPSGDEILLVGDSPAPDAPDDPGFHYTPFGAPRNSSLWLNRLLEQFKIDEAQLGWMNAYDKAGLPTNPRPLSYRWSQIIALGGSPSSWLKRHGIEHRQFMHPQAWKRFHSKEPYPLIPILHVCTP
jgi:hypothetical protein